MSKIVSFWIFKHDETHHLNTKSSISLSNRKIMTHRLDKNVQKLMHKQMFYVLINYRFSSFKMNIKMRRKKKIFHLINNAIWCMYTSTKAMFIYLIRGYKSKQKKIQKSNKDKAGWECREVEQKFILLFNFQHFFLVNREIF